MAYLYETVVSTPIFEIFQRAFTMYMEKLECNHMSVGRLGALSSHQFQIDDKLVSLTASSEGQSKVKVAIHSDTVPVERLVLDALTEGAADLLQGFVASLSDRSSEQVFQSLIEDLRHSFGRVVGPDGELVM